MAKKPILIVDDNSSIRSALQFFFDKEGYQVTLACDGQEAIDILQKSHPLLFGMILVDYRMPVMNGSTFFVELQSRHPEIFSQIPIFLMTAGTDSDHSSIKMTGFLQKPFDLDVLARIAAQYCG